MEASISSGEFTPPILGGTAKEAATPPSKSEVTQWLVACEKGDPRALESLLPLVYDELHRQAAGFFRRERAGHTLRPRW